jgi:hypothetical protein
MPLTDEWRPIKTAPIGKPFLAKFENGAICVSAFVEMPEEKKIVRNWIGQKRERIINEAGVYFFALIPSDDEMPYAILSLRTKAKPIEWRELEP